MPWRLVAHSCAGKRKPHAGNGTSMAKCPPSPCRCVFRRHRQQPEAEAEADALLIGDAGYGMRTADSRPLRGRQAAIAPLLEGVERLIVVESPSAPALQNRNQKPWSDSWDVVQMWALKHYFQRGAGRSVLFVLHAGKTLCAQRCTSKREDVLHRYRYRPAPPVTTPPAKQATAFS